MARRQNLLTLPPGRGVGYMAVDLLLLVIRRRRSDSGRDDLRLAAGRMLAVGCMSSLTVIILDERQRRLPEIRYAC